MSLLIFGFPYNIPLPLAEGFPAKFPWTQMVNRVLLDKIDPFHYTLVCEKIEDIVSISCGRTFEEMVEERALELKNIPDIVYVMWSGGIDSSTTLLSLILNWPKEDLERVHILASYESKVEFPVFWNLLTQMFKNRIHTSYAHPEQYLQNGHIITGEHGDQIFGSDIINIAVKYFGDEAINRPWQEIMPPIYRYMFNFLSAEKFVNRYLPTLSKSLYPIRTTFEWVWWFNFTNKWQHVKHRMLLLKDWENPSITFKKVHHFFDTPKWQKWSMENPDKKIKDTLTSYKWPAKQFIVKEIKDQSYLSKPKLPSLKSVFLNKEFYPALDTDYQPLTFQQGLEYIRKP